MEETLYLNLVVVQLLPKKCYMESTQYVVNQSEFDVFFSCFLVKEGLMWWIF